MIDEASIPRDHYFNENYFRFPALASLCSQIVSIHQAAPTAVLEVGKGNGFVSDFLTKAGYNVTTLDINPALQPDVVGSLFDLDQHFNQGQFDLVVCAEVLEHLPFEDFAAATKQLAFACRGGNALVTIPRAQRILLDYTLDLRVGRFKRAFDLFLSVPSTRISPRHKWELDHSPATRMSNVKKLLAEQFYISKVERVRHCAYHRLFKLQSRKRP